MFLYCIYASDNWTDDLNLDKRCIKISRMDEDIKWLRQMH